MFEYIVIFFFTVSLTCMFSSQATRKQNNKLVLNGNLLISATLLILFIGLRFNVGRDFPAYANDLHTYSSYNFGEGTKYQFEYGHLAVCWMLDYLKADEQWLFIVYSILTIIPFLALYRKYPNFLVLGVFVFFLCLPYEFVINGMRQGVAIFIFLNACNNLGPDKPLKKSLLKFLMLTLIATLFHTSCLFFLLLYPLFRLRSFYNLNGIIVFIIAASGLAIGLSGISDVIIPFSVVSGTYEDIFEQEVFSLNDTDFGIGQLLSYLFYLLPLLFYNDLTKEDPQIKKFYLLYALGIFVFHTVLHNLYIARISYYMLFSEVLVYPSFIKYCIRQSSGKNSILAYLTIIWFIILFFYSLPNFYTFQLWPNATLWGISIN